MHFLHKQFVFFILTVSLFKKKKKHFHKNIHHKTLNFNKYICLISS